MLEYVFFQEASRKRFQEFLTAQGLTWTLEAGVLETLVVVDEVGLDDELAERLEAMYDELFAAEQVTQAAPLPPALHQQGGGSGLGIKLPDGRTIQAQLPPELVSRLLTVITAHELGALAELIARAVANAHWPQQQGT